jgi:2-dehydropantoate 2-reductase
MNEATKPSMLRDLERGKRLEIDALNGAVSRFGHQLSVPTPANDFIYATLKLQDLKAAGNAQM